MATIISPIVAARIDRGEAQRVHIPWPTEALGQYRDVDNPTTDADVDAWVAANCEVPSAAVIGVCPGRAKRAGGLVPVIVLTLVNAEALRLKGSYGARLMMRNTWADGHGVARG